MPLEAGLLEILACPACHAPLREAFATDTGAATGTAADTGAEPTELVCTGADCGLAYPIRDGIPVLLVDEARRPA
ncbi:Trm112 family protein [Streptomyces sp. KR80]|uniref:Trm112 family protein n=1 Tax=Streptomyces sp. KR80 TaxID=3457426 RepID=UPI003FCF6AEA